MKTNILRNTPAVIATIAKPSQKLVDIRFVSQALSVAVIAAELALLVLLFVAGFASTAYSAGSWTQSTAANWGAGSGVNVDTTTTPGTVTMPTSLLNNTTFNIFLPDASNWGNGSSVEIDTTSTIGGIKIGINNVLQNATTTFDSNTALADHWVEVDLGYEVGNTSITVMGAALLTKSGGGRCTQQVELQACNDNSSWQNILQLEGYDTGGSFTFNNTYFSFIAYRYYRIYITYNNQFSFTNFLYGAQFLDVTAFCPTGTYTTQALDFGKTPAFWGNLTSSYILGAGSSVSFETRSSINNVNWQPWLVASTGTVIPSTLGRYLQVHAFLNSSADYTQTPLINSIGVNAGAVASYTSQVLNASTYWNGWESFSVNNIQPSGGSINYYAVTSTSSNNLNAVASVPLANGGQIPSIAGPYLQIISSFSTTSASAIPVIDSYTVTWSNGWNISGYVYEPNEAVISSATVEAINGTTTYYAQTNSAGYYQMLVPAGNNWTVSVSSLAQPGIFTFTNNNSNGSSYTVTSSTNMTGVSFYRVDNTAPVLGWSGETGYNSYGVSPLSGTSATTFSFAVRYTDAENASPGSGYPIVYILNGGTTVQALTMNYPVGSNYTPLANGVICSTSTLLPPATYTYYFAAQDQWDLQAAVGYPTYIQSGPVVVESITPLLSFTNETNYTGRGVYPVSGDINTAFCFHVMYIDSTNYPPGSGYPKVNILNGGTTVYSLSMNLNSGSYATGAIYSTSTLLAPCLCYTYNFQTCDPYGCASTTTVTGSLQVIAPKPNGPQSASPGLTNGASITSGQAVFSWECPNPDNDILTYTLYLSNPVEEPLGAKHSLSPAAYRANASNTFNPIYTGPNTTYTLNSLEPGMVYYWQVQAANQYNAVSLSPVYSFDTVKQPKRAYSYPKYIDPARGILGHIVFEMAEDGDADVTIYSEFGNRCWGHNYCGLHQGTNQIIYDGRDNSGNMMYNGTYPVVIIKRYANGEQTDHCRVLIIK